MTTSAVRLDPTVHERTDAYDETVSEIRAVLFDLGGVIVRLGDLESLLGPGSGWESAEFWPSWILNDTVQSFERGQCTTADFCAGVVCDFGLSLTPDEFGERFVRWPKGLFAGASDVVEAIPEHIVTATASNTNPLHWDSGFADAPNQIDALFDKHYPSFRLGLAKPSAEYFEAILSDMGFEPEHVLFLDDNEVNVVAARGLSVVAERVDGPSGARQALVTHGVVAPSDSPIP